MLLSIFERSAAHNIVDMIAQIAATAVFLAMFALIITEKIEKYMSALICGGVTLIVVLALIMKSPVSAVRTLNIRSIFEPEFWYHSDAASTENTAGINWATIIFIAGMMLMVEFMASTGFFKWLCVSIAKMVNFRIVPVFFTSMILSAVLAMFIDSITVILFLAAVTIELSSALKFDPVPFILAEIFCANLGGSATMCGDPPNIIIGTSFGYSFGDFLSNTGPIAAVSFCIIIIFFYFCFRKNISSTGKPEDCPLPSQMITDKRKFIMGAAMFSAVIILLATHGSTGLTVAFIGTAAGILSLILSGREAADIIKNLDYKTLLFFIGLFMVVGGLEQTGALESAANIISMVSGGNISLTIFIIIWLSGIASAFVDNIPFSATMIPVIRSLASVQGIEVDTLAWALAMGTDIGGSATPIGASANVVGISAAHKKGYRISWKKYCIYMVPATVIVMTISTLWLINI